MLPAYRDGDNLSEDGFHLFLRKKKERKNQQWLRRGLLCKPAVNRVLKMFEGKEKERILLVSIIFAD